VVEFALCLPILFTLMFAMIEFSRLMQVQQAVREAALEGARTGLTLDGTAGGAQAQATNILSMAHLSGTTVVGTTLGGSGGFSYTSTSVSVTVSVNPSGNSWFIHYLTAGHPITATVMLDREVQAISVAGSGGY
jgi:Flp pilus assembly protein TadG